MNHVRDKSDSQLKKNDYLEPRVHGSQPKPGLGYCISFALIKSFGTAPKRIYFVTRAHDSLNTNP